MYCSTDMMTDEDKEATIKSGRVLRSDEAHVDMQRGERAMARKEARKRVGGHAEAQGRLDSVFDWMFGEDNSSTPTKHGQ